MLYTLVSFTLPLAGFLVYILIIIILLLWRQYCKFTHYAQTFHETTASGGSFNHVFSNYVSNFYVFMHILKGWVVLFLLYIFYFLKINSFNFKFLYFNNFIINQLYLFSFFYFFAIYFLFFKFNRVKSYPIDFGIFLIFLYFSGFFLLISNNFLNVFIILEVINLLIIYSFIINLQFNNLSTTLILNKSVWLLNACIYQFILNFFSSILFYISFNMLISATSVSTFWNLGIFNEFNFNLSSYFTLVYISFFIKFGIGPWIFFKIEIYKNFNYILLLFYTISYFLVLLIFFFNLFFIYNLPINLIQLSLIIFFILFLIFIFSVFLQTYFNLFIFFSFSSLLNIMSIFFQWFTILCIM